MSIAAPASLALRNGGVGVPSAAFEILSYLLVVSAATLAFAAGWLTLGAAVVLTVLILVSLVVLSWIRLGQGRHPAFLFLSSLLFFQGGRLIGFCLGAEPDPMQVVVMTYTPFQISRETQMLVLLALVMSAICIYAPCRWFYRHVPPPDLESMRKYLPYLYILFAIALPFQLFRNYRYYQYAMEHGGYVFLYINRAALASSVPFVLRAFSLITLPVFVAIFTFERRRSRVVLATALYFLTAALVLLLGSRAGPLLLVGTLWWISRVKASRKLRVVRLVFLALALVLIADAVQEHRTDDATTGPYRFSPLRLVVSQGNSLNVTEIAFEYRQVFSRYAFSYLRNELSGGFIASDVSNYQRGKALAIDTSVFLQPQRYSEGFGSGGSYVAEAYVLGGLIGLVLVSAGIGLLLHAFYRLSGSAMWLYVCALAFPDVLLMPKGQLLDWISVLAKNLIVVLLIAVGWRLYCMLTFIRHTASPGDRASSATA